MKEFFLKSLGKGNIHCCKWEPEGNVRGVVQIVHGIAEYAARYDDIAKLLNEHGFAIVAEDHMGHGGSISEDTVQGYFYGGWLNAADDTMRLFERTKSEYPDVPYFIYGHSMGSFLTRTILYRYPDAGFAGAIISGTGWQPGLILKLGLAVCKMQAKKLGDTATSPTVQKLMFGNYTKSYENPKTPLDWLSRDEALVEAYIADPLCGFDPTIGLSADMLSGMQMNEKKDNLAKMPKELPVFMFSGDMDPVGANGKGVKKTFDAFKAAGMKNVTMKLYKDGRHEMHNELNKDEVYADVLNFLETNI